MKNKEFNLLALRQKTLGEIGLLVVAAGVLMYFGHKIGGERGADLANKYGFSDEFKKLAFVQPGQVVGLGVAGQLAVDAVGLIYLAYRMLCDLRQLSLLATKRFQEVEREDAPGLGADMADLPASASSLNVMPYRCTWGGVARTGGQVVSFFSIRVLCYAAAEALGEHVAKPVELFLMTGGQAEKDYVSATHDLYYQMMAAEVGLTLLAFQLWGFMHSLEGNIKVEDRASLPEVWVRFFCERGDKQTSDPLDVLGASGSSGLGPVTITMDFA